jgi:Spy/CpxP family protein refolding chaperone
MIVSPHWFLSPQVMPAALDTDMAALARHLNLSPSQVDGITEVRNRFYRETRDLRYGLLEKRMELRKLLSDPKTDERLLLKRQREVSDLWQKLADMVGRAVIEARRLLNPEQIERLDQLPL